MKHFVRDGNCGRALGAFGIDVGEALRMARLPEDTLCHPAPTMMAEEYYAFVEAVGELAGREDAAVALASADGVEQFSPPIIALFCARWMGVHRTACPLQAHHRSHGVHPDGRQWIADGSAGVPRVQEGRALLPRAVRDRVPRQRVVRRHQARDQPRRRGDAESSRGTWFEEFLDCEVQAGTRDDVTFADADLAVPFFSRNDAMWGYFEPELGCCLSELDVDEGMSTRVRSALVEALPAGEVGIDEIARWLGQSKGTLQRRLGEERTAFQKQLNHVREMLAKRYLTTTSMRTDQIAFMLGYVEHNSFLRAFSSWTGLSPSEYRTRQKH